MVRYLPRRKNDCFIVRRQLDVHVRRIFPQLTGHKGLPLEFTPNLAAALNNQSVHLAAAGRSEEWP